jgi:MSHA biogenesis protein MshG
MQHAATDKIDNVDCAGCVGYGLGVSLRHRIRFFQQMAVLIRAGVPLRRSLDRLKESMRDRELAVLSEKVNAGERIGDAFTAAGFSPFECHLVMAGERSAQLDTIFEHLAEYWTRELRMRQAFIPPLIYPIVVLHFVVLLTAAIEFVQLPLPVVVIHLIWRFAIFYALGFLIYMGARVSWGSESMRRFWYFVPLVGKSLATTYCYRWITALRLEFTAGVSLYRAVGDAWRASGFAGSERLAAEGEQAMQQGTELSKLMEGWKQLPRDWIDFVVTGEISGKLEDSFKTLEAEAEHTWKMAQQRLADWAPKIVYFVALIFVAFQVGSLMYKVEIQPIIDAEKQIDDIGK